MSRLHCGFSNNLRRGEQGLARAHRRSPCGHPADQREPRRGHGPAGPSERQLALIRSRLVRLRRIGTLRLTGLLSRARGPDGSWAVSSSRAGAAASSLSSTHNSRTIYCSAADRVLISRRAQEAGMSFSRFMVACALHGGAPEASGRPARGVVLVRVTGALYKGVRLEPRRNHSEPRALRQALQAGPAEERHLAPAPQKRLEANSQPTTPCPSITA